MPPVTEKSVTLAPSDLNQAEKRSHRGRSHPRNFQNEPILYGFQPRNLQNEAATIRVESMVRVVPVLPHDPEIGVESMTWVTPVLPPHPEDRYGSEPRG